MRRLKLVEKEQTVDKEGWLKLQPCVKVSFLSHFKGTVSPSPCLASEWHPRAHSLTPKLSRKTPATMKSTGVSLGAVQPSHCQSWPLAEGYFSKPGACKPMAVWQCIVVFLLKPPPPGTTLANSCGSRLKKQVACLKPAGSENPTVFLLKPSVSFY